MTIILYMTCIIKAFIYTYSYISKSQCTIFEVHLVERIIFTLRDRNYHITESEIVHLQVANIPAHSSATLHSNIIVGLLIWLSVLRTTWPAHCYLNLLATSGISDIYVLLSIFLFQTLSCIIFIARWANLINVNIEVQ